MVKRGIGRGDAGDKPCPAELTLWGSDEIDRSAKLSLLAVECLRIGINNDRGFAALKSTVRILYGDDFVDRRRGAVIKLGDLTELRHHRFQRVDGLKVRRNELGLGLAALGMA